MLIALLTAAAVLVPQDAPPQDQGPELFTDSAFGVSLARPAPNWVLEPARTRGTTTVIFYPQGVSLGDQLWGALALTRVGRAIRLAEVADQRIVDAWQPTLGPSFHLLTRDSLTVAGLPALHVVMTGTINSTTLDVEEYLLARGTDLILLQFRYPHHMRRDSIAAAYERVLRSLVVHEGPIAAAPAQAAAVPPAPPPRAAPAPAPAPSVRPQSPLPDPRDIFVARPRGEMWSALAGSPWRAARVDVAMGLARRGARPLFAARLDIVNDGLLSLDTVPLWIPPGHSVDSLRLGQRAVTSRYGAHGLVVELPDTIPFQGVAALTVYYSGPPLGGTAALLDHWLPAVESPFDSLGQYRATSDPPITYRFDLPEGLAAVATGRMTADLVASGRHRQIWTAEGVASRRPGFVVGPFVPVGRGAGRLTMTLWSPVYSDAPLDSCARLVAAAWAWHARAFGSVMAPEVHLVVGAPVVRGLPGLLLFTDHAADDAAAVFREVARTWWGGAVRGAGPGGTWIEEAWPVWSGLVASAPAFDRRSVEQVWRGSDGARAPLAPLTAATPAELELVVAKGVTALEETRAATSEPRFREVVARFAAEYRGRFATGENFLDLLDEAGRGRLREFLHPRP